LQPAVGTVSGRVMLVAVVALGPTLVVMVCRLEVTAVAEGVVGSRPVGERGRSGEKEK